MSVVSPCPDGRQSQARAIALRDVPPSQRDELIAGFFSWEQSRQGTLLVAMEGEELVDAAWGQWQPGNTAYLWQPKRHDATAQRLTQAVGNALDAAGVRMTQTMVPDRDVPGIWSLEAAGFAYLADLVYLSWQTCKESEPPAHVRFEQTKGSQLGRFAQLIESTYVETQDCPAMNGRRPMDEVLGGYRATGTFRPENWQIAAVDGVDVGVLLLADHSAANYWELVYMGVVPGYRGRALGREIVRHAQEFARKSGTEQLLVAVDAANAPALRVYESAGFVPWDRRIVYVRFNNRAP